MLPTVQLSIAYTLDIIPISYHDQLPSALTLATPYPHPILLIQKALTPKQRTRLSGILHFHIIFILLPLPISTQSQYQKPPSLHLSISTTSPDRARAKATPSKRTRLNHPTAPSTPSPRKECVQRPINFSPNSVSNMNPMNYGKPKPSEPNSNQAKGKPNLAFKCGL